MTTLPADEPGAYRCPSCGTTDPLGYVRCHQASCPDGRDPRPQSGAELSSLRAKLAEAMGVTPEMLAAAWAAWKQRHGGKLGPGPAFRETIEAIEAAFAARRLIEGNGNG